ncbi:hypothetical protein FB446DRAFT_842649 [Lentinula raphanica]|nr:hypothetical protein FB446DRAFT_842649 [Lentinula raphanica]
MVHSRSVLKVVIAVGAASSVLAAPVLSPGSNAGASSAGRGAYDTTGAPQGKPADLSVTGKELDGFGTKQELTSNPSGTGSFRLPTFSRNPQPFGSVPTKGQTSAQFSSLARPTFNRGGFGLGAGPNGIHPSELPVSNPAGGVGSLNEASSGPKSRRGLDIIAVAVDDKNPPVGYGLHELFSAEHDHEHHHSLPPPDELGLEFMEGPPHPRHPYVLPPSSSRVEEIEVGLRVKEGRPHLPPVPPSPDQLHPHGHEVEEELEVTIEEDLPRLGALHHKLGHGPKVLEEVEMPMHFPGPGEHFKEREMFNPMGMPPKPPKGKVVEITVSEVEEGHPPVKLPYGADLD